MNSQGSELQVRHSSQANLRTKLSHQSDRSPSAANHREVGSQHGRAGQGLSSLGWNLYDILDRALPFPTCALIDQTGRPTQLATSYIPAGLAAELPVLAARDTAPGGIYDRMEEAVSARSGGRRQLRPVLHPMEASRLGLAPGAALLRIRRLASSPADRPTAGSQRHAHERRRVRDQLPLQPGCLRPAANVKGPDPRPRGSRVVMST